MKAFSLLLPTLVSRVVSGIHVVDYPRSHAVELHNRLTFNPNGMNHSSRPNAKGPDRQYLRVSDLGVLAHGEFECALNDGHTLRSIFAGEYMFACIEGCSAAGSPGTSKPIYTNVRILIFIIIIWLMV